MQLEDLRSKRDHFESTRQGKQKHYKQLEKLRKQFVKIFTTTKIENMDKDDYVVGKVIKGKPNKNAFCYWVEFKTEEMGKIQGPRANKFVLYMDKKSQQYKFTKRLSNENEAFDFIKREIIRLIKLGEGENWEEIKKIELSPMFKGKILFLYYPNKFINIFAEKHVDHFLKEIGIYQENKNLSLIDKRERLLRWKNNDSVMKNWSMFEFKDFLYDEFRGPPKKKQTPDELKGYIDFKEEYPNPEKVKSEFIALEINPESTQFSSEKRKGKKRPIDFEKENKRHKKLGEHGELIVVHKEKNFLTQNGRMDLAERIKQISKEEPSAGYDVLSYELDGSKKRIEVKSTSKAPSNIANFVVTINEYNKAKKINNYYLYIVFEVKSKNPKIWPIKKPFQHEGKGLDLTPISFRVTVNIK